MKKIIILSCILCFTLQSFSQLAKFQDTLYHFEFEYPETWVPASGSDQNLRLILISEDKSIQLETYAIFVEAGHVMLEKFADQDTLMFPLLGEISETDKEMMVPYIGKYLAFIAEGADEIVAIRKKYHPNEDQAYAFSFFVADEHYAYALIAYSKTGNFKGVEDIFDSFEKTSTRKIRQKNNQSNAHREKVFFGILAWSLIFIYFFLLMLAGRNFKKWSRRRKALLTFKRKQAEGYEPDRKWRYAFRKASNKFLFSIALFLLLFAVGILLNSENWWMYAAAPGAFILGYLGFTLVVDDPS